MSGGIDPLVEALGLAPKQDEVRKKLFDSLPRRSPYTGYHVHSVERLTAPGRARCACGMGANLKLNDVVQWDDVLDREGDQ